MRIKTFDDWGTERTTEHVGLLGIQLRGIDTRYPISILQNSDGGITVHYDGRHQKAHVPDDSQFLWVRAKEVE